MARVLRASAAITKAKHPRGYQDFTRDKMDLIIRKPLSAEDYEKADRIMLLMMQPQVKTLLDSQPVGKKKAKSVQQGMSTLPEEFMNWPIIGPNNPTKTQVNSGSLSSANSPKRTNCNVKDVGKDTPNGSGYLDFSEFHTLLVKCADMINSHPSE